MWGVQTTSKSINTHNYIMVPIILNNRSWKNDGEHVKLCKAFGIPTVIILFSRFILEPSINNLKRFSFCSSSMIIV